MEEEEPIADDSARAPLVCSTGARSPPTEMLGTDQVDGDELCVKVNGTPFDVTAEEGTLDEVVAWFAIKVVLTFGGRGGTGGRSFGIGGMSRTSTRPLIPAEVQLDDPDNESEPSTSVGSAVLALFVGCASPLATF